MRELCMRIDASQKTVMDLLQNRPAFLRGGCKLPAVETENTCLVVGCAIDPDVANWLRSQGVRMDVVWKDLSA